MHMLDHMAVEGAKASSRQSLRFLYELREGPTNESFGIHVAQLAGLPKPVTQRAWKVLAELEAHATNPSSFSNQLSLFERPRISDVPLPEPELSEPHPVLKELESTPLNDMTPLQALNFVAKLQSMVC